MAAAPLPPVRGLAAPARGLAAAPSLGLPAAPLGLYWPALGLPAMFLGDDLPRGGMPPALTLALRWA